MSQTTGNDTTFVVDILTTLRKERFSPPAWLRFLRRSWTMSCTTANANPSLKRSWLHTTLFIAALASCILLATWHFEGVTTTFRLLPTFLFCIAWQQSDLFWHLGLNRHPQTGQLLQKVGLANLLTWLRALAASYLLARLIGGLATPSSQAFAVFLIGVLTDILDGQIARHTHMQSKLGEIADGEVDFCLYLAITIMLVQNAILPYWLGLLMLLRFLLPLLAVVVSYFLFAHPIRYGSTIIGKYAGLAQCLYLLVLLAPPQLAFFTHLLNLPLLIVTLILLIAAPIAQFLSQK